ncbi:hypothetical protein GARCT_03099 [Geobacillus sp. 12AMOR1]|nr:hypothetical protein GARCT_03099 [Geobacillus sp. 12AMOR1]
MSQNLESLIPYIEKIKKMKFREDLGLLFESNTGIIHRVDGDIGVLILSLIRQNHDINYIKNYILQEYDVQEEELIDDIFVFIS